MHYKFTLHNGSQPDQRVIKAKMTYSVISHISVLTIKIMLKMFYFLSVQCISKLKLACRCSKYKNMPPFFLVVSSFSTSTNIHHPPHQPMQIINERYRAYSWVAELIQVFIAISVTVSFLVMGSAMKHTSKFTPAWMSFNNLLCYHNVHLT